MFQAIANIGAAILLVVPDVVFPSYPSIFAAVHRMSQIGAEDAFVADFRPNGCLAAFPADVPIETQTVDVRHVEILAKSCASHQLEIIVGAVPIEGGQEAELPFRLSAYTHEVSLVALELVGIGGRVESVGSVGLLRQAELPVEVELLVGVVALIIELSASPVVVRGASIGATSAAAQSVAEFAKGERHASVCLKGAVHAAFGSCGKGTQGVLPRDDVYAAAKRGTAIYAAIGTRKDFDALDVLGTDWEVCGKMAGLRAADVYAVQQEGYLVERASVDTDVRLDTKASALTDIDARG